MSRKIALTLYTDDKSASINTAYIDFVAAAGYDPVIVTQHSPKLLEICDGLLLPGGIDISPIPYGENNTGSMYVNPSRDMFERAMMLSAFTSGKPVFGICRGFQLICREVIYSSKTKLKNFVYKQHINGHNQTQSNCPRNAEFHYVYFYGTSILPSDDILDNDYMLPVNSMHHQAVMVINPRKPLVVENGATKLEVIAVSAEAQREGMSIVEAVTGQYANTKFTAVQWHPEELMQTWLLTEFFGDA